MVNLKNIPSMDELLASPYIKDLLTIYKREFVVDILRQAVAETRQELRLKGGDDSEEGLFSHILNRFDKLITAAGQGTLQRVINGTGVVLHTNLGRAPLGNRALEYLKEMGRVYNNLEFNLDTGERGSRYRHVEELLTGLTGAEAGLVVNNNAAAVLLGLTALAQGKEVIVSRGQLIEIGGAFRIPEVMKQSGAHLVEVGTTNKTYISDYAAAINDNTGLLFSAHTSNYKIVGFSEEVRLRDLVALGEERQIPVMHDLGSGILLDLGEWGLQDEPTIQASVDSGAHIISFSGDKLLGGPQAGIIVGKKEYIDAMKKHQLTRALRVDKLTIAALEGTLLEYLSGDPLKGIPVLEMLTASREELRAHAEQLGKLMEERLLGSGRISDIRVVQLEDMVGGGAYPTHKITGYGVKIVFEGKRLEHVAHRLLKMNPAVLTRKQEDSMLISVRTLREEDMTCLVEQMARALLSGEDTKIDTGEIPCSN